ncbi:hypothetical protein B5T_02444 [Alloalcanivorax dieselolei B5]|uniref:Uncharacterized protein n=1 Tax=Alcanivorax dieselolei (strain DSM 16502 / CGMCC 1.3690 / MCCC 1A00001 / B-5) TaxID=930169 RepID=K0CDQ5_ALCDB|nr:hypothetical protein B5T_02444 [Alloalcanivorax dieselolei B5]
MPTATPPALLFLYRQCGRRGLACLLLFVFSLPAHAALLTLPIDEHSPLIGAARDQLMLVHYRDGAFHEVRHQWLPWTLGHQPYFQEDRDARRDAPVDRVAAGDRLLLRSGDAGEVHPMPLPAEVLATLPIADGDGDGDGVFYVLRARPRATFAPAATLERDPLAISGDRFRLAFVDDNLFRWGDFTYQGWDGEGTLLDGLKLRLSAGLLLRNARVTLDNDNLDPVIRQVIAGPLATLVYATTRVRVAGLRVLTVHNYFIVGADSVVVHSRFTLPAVAAAVLREPSARITVDGYRLQGARLRTSWTGAREAVVDGVLSDTEKAMRGSTVPRDNTVWFDTGKGFALRARLRFMEGFDTPVRFIYQDDPQRPDPPERFPGQEPEVGFLLKDLPFGQEYYVIAELWFSSALP